MEIDNMIEVLTAYKQGKTIQVRNQSEIWLDTDSPKWSFDCCDYRVKPEPREFYICPGKHQQDYGVCEDCNIDGEICGDAFKVREVLD